MDIVEDDGVVEKKVKREPKGSMTKEPLITVASLTALVAAGITLGVEFGLNLTDSQVTAIMGFIAITAPLLVGFVARGKVYSPAGVDLVVEESTSLALAESAELIAEDEIGVEEDDEDDFADDPEDFDPDPDDDDGGEDVKPS